MAGEWDHLINTECKCGRSIYRVDEDSTRVAETDGYIVHHHLKSCAPGNISPCHLTSKSLFRSTEHELLSRLYKCPMCRDLFIGAFVETGRFGAQRFKFTHEYNKSSGVPSPSCYLDRETLISALRANGAQTQNGK